MKDETWIWIAIGAVALLSFGGLTYLGIGVLSASQIATLARNAGFSGSDVTTAVAVALAESGGNPQAHGDLNLGSGTGSFGLWQIYSDAHPEYGPNFDQLYDPQTNANAAYAIYLAAGQSFRPWTVFTHNTYLNYMNEAQNA